MMNYEIKDKMNGEDILKVIKAQEVIGEAIYIERLKKMLSGWNFRWTVVHRTSLKSCGSIDKRGS